MARACLADHIAIMWLTVDSASPAIHSLGPKLLAGLAREERWRTTSLSAHPSRADLGRDEARALVGGFYPGNPWRQPRRPAFTRVKTLNKSDSLK